MTVDRIAFATQTHKGLVRTRNQDCLLVDAERGIVILADGMGGHRAGEVASRLAVETAMEDLRAEGVENAEGDGTAWLMQVGHAVELANRRLVEKSSGDPELQGMGTTVVLAIFRGGRIYHAHVGDSRLYRVRYGRLRRLTRDHSLIQRMIDEGIFANKASAREAGIRDNVLTRSLGMQLQTEVDVGDSLAEPGDTYLFCSDGLHGTLPDSEIARILRDPAADLADQAQALTDAALAAGGNDNVSVVLARRLAG
jgi:protein phosphatase